MLPSALVDYILIRLSRSTDLTQYQNTGEPSAERITFIPERRIPAGETAASEVSVVAKALATTLCRSGGQCAKLRAFEEVLVGPEGVLAVLHSSNAEGNSVVMRAQ